MYATFKLDGCHVLEIGGEVFAPRLDSKSVGIQLVHTPHDGVRQGPMPSQYPQDAPRPDLTEEQKATAVFYGPYPCEVCGCQIVRVSAADGGHPFDQPDGPIYPNTHWVKHVHREAPFPRPEIKFSVSLPPSHARAIASAILSAATEARS
jgi:hypothetical protein